MTTAALRRPPRTAANYAAPYLPNPLQANTTLRVPLTACTLDGFVDWVTSDDFPPFWRVSFLGQELFITMSPEELETHNKVRLTVTSTIYQLVNELDQGEVFTGGTLYTNEAAGLSTESDGLFVKWESYEAGRVRLVPRKNTPGQYMEVRGSADWALEIVSRTSQQKDTVILRDCYHRARVREFWLIDAMEDDIDFKILVWRSKGYVAVRPRDGWVKSPLFGCAFRLERRRNRVGHWQYTLRVRTT